MIKKNQFLGESTDFFEIIFTIFSYKFLTIQLYLRDNI